MSERLTTERMAEIEKRRAETKRHPIDSDGYDEAWDYFYSDAPRYVDELLEEVWRLRARVAELEAPREGILATAQALRLRVNEAAGQEAD